MLFSLQELLDVLIMTLIVGYLFKDAFRLPKQHVDVLDYYRAKDSWSRNWHDLAWAVLLVAPSIILHELGHKFTAMAFGLQATFHAACGLDTLSGVGSGLCGIQLLALLMKYMGYGFLIFVPAYVNIADSAPPVQHALISFMGPFVHLVFWVGATVLLRNRSAVRSWPRRTQLFVLFLKRINLFLFILNMIPIPGFDGYWVLTNLFEVFKALV